VRQPDGGDERPGESRAPGVVDEQGDGGREDDPEQGVEHHDQRVAVHPVHADERAAHDELAGADQAEHPERDDTHAVPAERPGQPRRGGGDQHHLNRGQRQRRQQRGPQQAPRAVRHLQQARGLLLDGQEHAETGYESERPEGAEVGVLGGGDVPGDDRQVGVDEQPGSHDGQADEAERPRPRPGAAGQDSDLPRAAGRRPPPTIQYAVASAVRPPGARGTRGRRRAERRRAAELSVDFGMMHR
jgi:hypothetical protein